MYRYLLFVLGLLPLTAFAQQKPASSPKATPTKPVIPADTIYFDQDWARTDIPEDCKFARLIRHDADGQPTGTVHDYYLPSWKKQWEGKLLSEDPEVASGLCTFWHENGKMKTRGTYVRGEAQSDYQEWRPDGLPVKCKTRLAEALPMEEAQLHSYLHPGGSQHVFYAALPANTTSAIYRIDIRDETQPPVSWNSALMLAAVPSGMNLLSLGAAALQAEANQQKPPTASTQCHYFVTTDRDQAQAFLQSQGKMPDANDCLFLTSSTQHEIRPVAIAGGQRQLYICVNNDNLQTAAIAKLSVTAVVKECK